MPKPIKTISFSQSTKYVYNKQTKTTELKTVGTVKIMARDSKGRFVKGGQTVKIQSETEFRRLFQSYETGKKSVNQIAGIVSSMDKIPTKKQLQNAKDGFYNVIENNYAMSDKQRDRLSYLMNDMSLEDFDAWYRENENLSNNVYATSPPSSSHRRANLIYGDDVKYQNIEDVITKMARFQGRTLEDVDNQLKRNYDKRGRYMWESNKR